MEAHDSPHQDFSTRYSKKNPLAHLLQGIVAAGLSVFLACEAQAGWAPAFVDNFNGDKINAAKWKTSKGNSSTVNLAYFSPEAITVSDGKLHLRVREAPLGGRPYSAGAVTTQQIFAQRYGYFEIRAKMPEGAGMWPAFWLLPVSNYWSSEVDVVEYAGAQPTVARYGYHFNFAHRPENSFNYDTAQDLSEDFHTYAVGWRPGRLDYYFDGKRVHTVTSDDVEDEAMYVILNLAVSSNQTDWAGPDKSTNFNESFEVDYIRIYRYNSDKSSGYPQIPKPAAKVADTADPAPYAAASIEVTLSDLDESYETSPASEGFEVDAGISIKSLSADSEGFVRAYLKPLSGYKNGRLTWGAPVARTSKLYFSLNKAGDRVDIPVRFALDPVEAGLYKMDVLASDADGGRLFNKSDLRRVQLLDVNSAPLIFDAFAINESAVYSGRDMQGGVEFQILEAIGLSEIEISYVLFGPDGGAPIMSWSTSMDFQNLEKTADEFSVTAPQSAVLTPDHYLRISVSDPFRQFTPIEIDVPLKPQKAAQAKRAKETLKGNGLRPRK